MKTNRQFWATYMYIIQNNIGEIGFKILEMRLTFLIEFQIIKSRHLFYCICLFHWRVLSCILYNKPVNVSKVFFCVLWVVLGNYLRRGLWKPPTFVVSWAVKNTLGSSICHWWLSYGTVTWAETLTWSLGWLQNWMELLDTQLVSENWLLFAEKNSVHFVSENITHHSSSSFLTLLHILAFNYTLIQILFHIFYVHYSLYGFSVDRADNSTCSWHNLNPWLVFPPIFGFNFNSF